MSPLLFSICSFATFLLLNSPSVVAASNDNGNLTIVDVVFHYRPNIAASAVVSVLYMAITISLLFLLIRARNWWGLCLPIGAACEGIGFILRIIVSKNPNSLPLFINMQIFIVCSPAAFLAFNYILLGRLKLYMGSEHSIIRPAIISRVFIISDISTFLIQSSGSSLETSSSMINIGQKIFLSGVILQAASYVLFCLLCIQIHFRVGNDPKISGSEPWWNVLRTLYFSSVFIIIRCIYRVIEAAQGNAGILMTHEIYFYLLDALPLIIAISIYIPFWPARFLHPVYSSHEMQRSRASA